MSSRWFHQLTFLRETGLEESLIEEIRVWLELVEIFLEHHLSPYKLHCYRREWNKILESKSPLLTLRRNKFVQNVMNECVPRSVHNFVIRDEDIGNALTHNTNTQKLCMLTTEKRSADFFSCLSTLVFGESNGKPLLKLLAIQQTFSFPDEAEKFLRKLNFSIREFIESILIENAVATPFTAVMLAEGLRKNLFLHMGSYDDSATTFKFATGTSKANIHILMIDGNYYPLVGQQSSEIQYVPKDGLHLRKCKKGERMISLSSFTHDLESKCDFCSNFQVKRCHHLLPKHICAANNLKSMKDMFNPTSIHASIYPLKECDRRVKIPANVGHCICVKTEPDGDCFFSSVSHFLCGSPNLALALRKALMAELLQNEGKYQKLFGTEFHTFKRKTLSMYEWGGDNSAAVLSRVVQRPIIFFRSMNDDNTGRMFNLSSLAFGYPIILLHIRNNHFQPLIPVDWSSFGVQNINDELQSYRRTLFQKKYLHLRSTGKCLIKEGKIQMCLQIPPVTHLQTQDIKTMAEKRERISKMLSTHTQTSFTTSLAKQNLQEDAQTSVAASLKYDDPQESEDNLSLFSTPYAKDDVNNCVPSSLEEEDLQQSKNDDVPASLEEDDLQQSKNDCVPALLEGEDLQQNENDFSMDITYFAKDDVSLLEDVIHLEFKSIGRLNQCGIEIFVTRSSFLKNFWMKHLTDLRPKYGNRNKVKGEYFLKLQQKDSGRKLVASILQKHGISEDVINKYFVKAEQIFRVGKKRKAVEPKRINGRNRTFPSYSTTDYGALPVTRISRDDPIHNSDVYELESDLGDQPQSEKSGSTVSLQSSQISTSSSYLKKRDMADAMGISVSTHRYPKDAYELSIDFVLVNQAYDFKTNKFNSSRMTDFLSNEISKKQGCCIHLRTNPYYYRRKRSKYFCKFYGKCQCRNLFKIFVYTLPQKGKNVSCRVEQSGAGKLIQTTKTGRQTRGLARSELAEKLQHTKPKAYIIQAASQLNDERLLHGNQGVTIHVARTTRSQAKRKRVYSNDVAEDLDHYKDECRDNDSQSKVLKGFVQQYSCDLNDLKISLYNEASLALLMNLSSGNNLTVHIDATGSICVKHGSREILLFLVLASCDAGNFPVAHFLTQRSRASDISQFFIQLLADMKSIRPAYRKPFAPVAVTDMSIPLLQGVSVGINEMNLIDYVTLCWNVLTGRTSFPSRRTLLTMCTNHLIDALSKRLSKILSTSKLDRIKKTVAVKSLVKIQECETLNELCIVYRVMCEFFSAKHADPMRVESLKHFLCEVSMDDEITLADSGIDYEDVEEKLGQDFRDASPFFQLFRVIKEAVEEKEQFEPNIYEGQRILQLLLQHYIPLTPLFCAAIIKKTGRALSNRMSNAVIESEFGVVKNNFHGKGRKFVGLFVRDQHVYHTGQLKSLLVENSKPKPKKPRVVNTKRPMEVEEEKWSKRKKYKTPKYVRPKKDLSPDKSVSRLNQILNNEIFKLSSETLLQNLILTKTGEEEIVPVTEMVQIATTKEKREEGEALILECEAELGEIRNILATFESKIDQLPGLRVEINEMINASEAVHHREDERKEMKKQSKFERADREIKTLADEIQLPNVDVPSVSNAAQILCRVSSDNLKILECHLTKGQLAEILTGRTWLEGNQVDFYLSHLKFKYPESKYMVSSHEYCTKYFSPSENKRKWNYDPKTQPEQPINELQKELNYMTTPYVLHPLLVVDHWSLLALDFESKQCTVFDSLMPAHQDNQRKKLEDYRDNVLPKFLPRNRANERRKWNINFCPSMRQQNDVYSCGLLTMAIAREIITNDNDDFNHVAQNVDAPETEREKILLDVLGTTNVGEVLLTIFERNYNDLKEYMLK